MAVHAAQSRKVNMSSIRKSHTVGEIQAAYILYLLAMTNFCEAVKRSAKSEGYFWQSIVWEARGALDTAIYADGFIGGSDPFSSLSWWEYEVNYSPVADPAEFTQWNYYYTEDQTDHVHSWACGTYTMCPNCGGAHCQDALRCECGTWLTLSKVA